MASRIKGDGVTGRLLHRMADRGGHLLCDYEGFPPSSVMAGPRKRGLVRLERTAGGKTRRNVWHLTAQAWAAIERTPPATDAA